MNQVLLLANGQLIPLLLLKLNDPPLRPHQLVMLLKLLLPQQLVILSYLLHLQLQLLNSLLILRWVAHLLSIIKQLLNIFLLVLQHLLLSLDLKLRLVQFTLLLLDYVLKIKYPLQGYLIGLLALIVSDCLLKPFDHLVCIFQLHILRLNRNRMPVLDIILLQLILRSLL